MITLGVDSCHYVFRVENPLSFQIILKAKFLKNSKLEISTKSILLKLHTNKSYQINFLIFLGMIPVFTTTLLYKVATNIFFIFHFVFKCYLEIKIYLFEKGQAFRLGDETCITNFIGKNIFHWRVFLHI